MKKNGFTLAETVITMAVIGVVAAISLPLINSFRIDENKVLLDVKGLFKKADLDMSGMRWWRL